jgi:hypothetical protein
MSKPLRTAVAAYEAGRDPGDLTELTPEIVAQLKSTNYYSFLAQPRTEAELKAFAEARNYRPGWVYQQLQDQRALAAGRP